MKIKSNVAHNVSFHKVPEAPYGTADYITIPAGSTLELEDKLWLSAYAGSKAIAGSLATGALTMVEHAQSSLSVGEMRKRIEAKASIKVDLKLKKSEVQALAVALGVDLSAAVELAVVEDEQEEECSTES